MISNKVFRTGIKKTFYQKTYELVTGAQSRTITFELSNRQFSFLEISLVFDSTHQHKSIYDSYNAEVAATTVSSIRLQNASDTYSEFNTVKFDLTDEHDKYIMYSAFITWICKDPASHRYQIMHIIQFIKKCQEKTNTLLLLIKGFLLI